MKTSRRRALAGLIALGGVAAAASVLIFLRDLPAQEPAAAAPGPIFASDWPLDEAETRGRAVYEKYCIGCHGDEGRGDGPAARFLDPLPRNFQGGKFKFRSTASGQAPLESDLMRTITCGLSGSSMPGFPLVPEIERRDVVRYVLHLAAFGRTNRRVAALVAEGEETLDAIRAGRFPAIREEVSGEIRAARRISIPPETQAAAASVDRGRALFTELCAACHGLRGVGDGTSSFALRDDQDGPIRPRDFTIGTFRAGSTPDDLFTRMRTGLAGTPMPAYADVSDERTWDLIHFILSLKDPHAEVPKMAPGCGREGGTR